MSQTEARQEILLESGTNELEVLVFSLGPTSYGVNVAKVREVIGQVSLIRVPMSHPAVVGVFKLREKVIPLVDLQLYFEPGTCSEATQRSVILMEFNNTQIGFLVDGVDRIHRTGWDKVQPMPLADQHTGPVITSVCELDNRLVLMIDFEKITFDIRGESAAFEVKHGVSAIEPARRGEQHVLLAEDSHTIRAAITRNLRQAGYVNVTEASNGGEAWSTLEASLTTTGSEPFTLIVTDIEMPRIDGFHLCKRIKEHPELKDLPVVVFSSLVSDANLKKCKAVGADAAITKPQMIRLVELLDGLVAITNPSDTLARGDLITIPD